MGYFCHFTSLTARKIKILKKWKKTLEISSFYVRVPKFMIRWCTVTEICYATDGRTDGQTDGWTDRRKKWHIEVGAPPKKSTKISFLLKIILNSLSDFTKTFEVIVSNFSLLILSSLRELINFYSPCNYRKTTGFCWFLGEQNFIYLLKFA